MRYLLNNSDIDLIRARCEGTSLIATLDAQIKTNSDHKRDALIEAAREMYCARSSDDIEVDDDASLSPADFGCWVEGWLWVNYEELVGNDET